MAKSILQSDRNYCFFCGANGSQDHLEKHHVMGGPNRKHSEQDGLYIWLCGAKCHRLGPHSVHVDKDTAEGLKRLAQAEFERTRGHKEWMERYGKNYLDGE